jgi:IclR family pca regulon transcriptional regulator
VPKTSSDIQPPAPGNIKRLEERHPRYSSSLDAGLAILQGFTAERQLRRVAEVADELGLSRSTAHRYFTTLVALGYAEQDKARRYQVGIRGPDTARAMLDCHPVCVTADPHLHELRRQISYTVTVAVLEDDFVRVLERLPGYRGHARLGQTLAIGRGSRLSLHCTGLGKTLLASLPDNEADAIIRSLHLRKRGPKTITRKDDFRRELLKVGDLGFAVEDEELSAGVVSLTAPIHGDDCPFGAIDVSAPLSLIGRDALVEQCKPYFWQHASESRQRSHPTNLDYG